jgi:flagellum-specific peptidoglycan hydrolase FlgJ
VDTKSTAVDLKPGDVREKPLDAVNSKKYGLLVKGNGSTGNSQKDGVGPSIHLLAKKADEEKREKESRNKPRENVKKLTAEEREERIRQMESDASEINTNRLERVHRSQTAVVDKDEKPLNEEATFINSMRTEVYVTDGTSMTERLQQNRHYIQKGSDLDSAGFIKK